MQSGLYEIVKPNAEYYYKNGDLVDAKTNTHATRDYPLYYKKQFSQEDLTDNKECVLPKIYKLDVLNNKTSRSVNESGIGVSKDFIEPFLCVDGKPRALSSLYKADDFAV